VATVLGFFEGKKRESVRKKKTRHLKTDGEWGVAGKRIEHSLRESVVGGTTVGTEGEGEGGSTLASSLRGGGEGVAFSKAPGGGRRDGHGGGVGARLR
jgi:hypothetical protein